MSLPVTSLRATASGVQSGSRLNELSRDEVSTRWPDLEENRVALALAFDNGSGSIVLGHEAFDSELFGLKIGRILAARAGSCI